MAQWSMFFSLWTVNINDNKQTNKQKQVLEHLEIKLSRLILLEPYLNKTRSHLAFCTIDRVLES